MGSDTNRWCVTSLTDLRSRRCSRSCKRNLPSRKGRQTPQEAMSARFLNSWSAKESARKSVGKPRHRRGFFWSSRTPAGGFDLGDVDLAHLHHRVERALGGLAVWVGDGFDQHPRRDLPVHAPLVLAPAAGGFLAAVADDGVPQAVGLFLVVGGDLEREGFGLGEGGAAVEAD